MNKRYPKDFNKLAEGMTSHDVDTRLETLAELHSDTWRIMCKFFYDITRDYQLAEDLTDATHIQITEDVHEKPMKHTHNIIGFYKTVGHNLYISHLRKVGNHQLISIDADNFPEHLLATLDDSVDENRSSKISTAEILSIYHTLPPREAVKWLSWKVGNYNPSQVECIFPFSQSDATIRRHSQRTHISVTNHLEGKLAEIKNPNPISLTLPHNGYTGFTVLGCNLEKLTQDGCTVLCQALDVQNLAELKKRYLGMTILHIVDIATVELQICFAPIHMGLDYLSGTITPYLECKPLFLTDQTTRKMRWYPTDLRRFTCQMIDKHYDAERAIQIGTWLYEFPGSTFIITKDIDAKLRSIFADPLPQIGTPFPFGVSFTES